MPQSSAETTVGSRYGFSTKTELAGKSAAGKERSGCASMPLAAGPAISAKPQVEKTMPMARGMCSGAQTSGIITLDTMKVQFDRPCRNRSATDSQKFCDRPKSSEASATATIEIRSGSFRPYLSANQPQGMPLSVLPKMDAELR